MSLYRQRSPYGKFLCFPILFIMFFFFERIYVYAYREIVVRYGLYFQHQSDIASEYSWANGVSLALCFSLIINFFGCFDKINNVYKFFSALFITTICLPICILSLLIKSNIYYIYLFLSLFVALVLSLFTYINIPSARLKCIESFKFIYVAYFLVLVLFYIYCFYLVVN